MMDGIYLLLGTNLGDKKSNLKLALTLIESTIGSIKKVSSIYQTAAWGIEDQPDFLNQVVEIESALKPTELLKGLLKIEEQMGRVRHIKWGERLIDIDILYINDLIINSSKLKVPHPEISNRRFTLLPLCELSKDFKHPVLDKTNQQLLTICEDTLEVKKMPF